MQGMKMADALVGATIKIALEKVVSFATDQIVMVRGFKEDLERLKKTVELVLVVVDDAEEKQVGDQAVNLWLKDLEELASRAERVLDELNYEMLRRTVEDQNPLKAKVRFISSHNTTVFHWRMARKFKEINKEFEFINKKASEYGLQFRLGSVANTTLLPTTVNREEDSVLGQIVVGRENDASRIVEKLLSPSSELLSFIPITGMGGLGKTTLAKLVYNHHEVVKHFGEKIWVSVSEHFEPKRIFKLILESLTKEKPNFEGRETIVQMIKEKLMRKKYLLVLDDVWNEKSELWDDFLGSLAGISLTPGNWIIVTTRKLQVASNLSAGFALERLSDEECLCIVKEKAPLCEEGIEEFETIKNKIKKLCQGLPLAASVIGGLLRTNPREQWVSVLQSGISNVNGDDEYSSIMQILKISFDHLPSPYLKKCFAYCSLFGKDSLMEKRELIELWMAEGFLQPTLDNDMETGNQCINILVQSSLLQEVTHKNGESSLVQMHDLVHNLAKSISKSKNDVKDVKPEDHYLVVDSFGEETKTLPEMKMLRTLFLGSGICDDMLMRLKHLHVLKLSYARTELPSSIGKLIHLRYLKYSNASIKALPKSLCKLYKLQTLDIDGCWSLEALPKGMTKLISLRHLHSHSNCRMPLEMGRLTKLQTLKHFHISEENQIKELGCLKNLRGALSIYNLERVSRKEIVLHTDLYRKSINVLKFIWSGEGENDEGVLDGLQPHSNLQELSIESFSGGEFPLWFMNMAICIDNNCGLSQRLDKLVYLSIRNCKRFKQLPALGQLPSLKELHLHGLENVSCIDRSFYGIDYCSGSASNISSCQVSKKIFPSLNFLHVSFMHNLKDWMEPEGTNAQAIVMFPNLENLYITNCPQLSSVPIHHFRSPKYLSIENIAFNHVLPVAEIDQNCRPSHSRDVQKEAIPTILESLTIKNCRNLRELRVPLYEMQKLRYLGILKCPNLISLPVPTQQQRLTSLKTLSIWECNGLSSLPCELLESCASLEVLDITCCNGLTSIPANLLKSCASLRSLRIYYCGGLTNLPNELLNSCISLECLDIAYCQSLTSIPTNLLKSCASLVSLCIYGCDGLTSLPCELLESCASLEQLHIMDCNGLTSIPANLLKSCASLLFLDISSCGGLTSIPTNLLKSCASLRSLCIHCCDGLTNLPNELLNSCISLERLDIACCQSLTSIPTDLQQVHSLSDLRLSKLPKLITLRLLLPSCFSRLSICEFSDSVEFDWSALSSSSSSLRQLELDGWPNLVSLPDPLQHLTALTDLSLRHLGQITDLPDWFSNLVSLKELSINDCEKLCYLPSAAAMRGLTKLFMLWISGCPLLTKRCSQRTSSNSEWAKISHIPYIHIDGGMEKSGK